MVEGLEYIIVGTPYAIGAHTFQVENYPNGALDSWFKLGTG